MKEMLFLNGPITVTFSVYEDFFSYSSGVYQHTTGKLLGYHAVKLLGWGTDWWSGIDYFFCQNSWGTKWGMGGFFYIA